MYTKILNSGAKICRDEGAFKVTEQELLEFLERSLKCSASSLIQGVGDDCAVVRQADRLLLLTVDAMVEGVHFDLAYFSPYSLGWKLAAANLSDVAAMGGQPLFGLLTLGLPLSPRKDFVEELLMGITDALQKYGACLVGGDSVKTERITLSLALTAEGEEGQVLFRKGAQPGDLIFVSRPLGASAMALELLRQGLPVPEALRQAHLMPEPEVTLGRTLAAKGLASAMIDVSDGLLLDLARLCRASGVGAEIWEAKIPLFEERVHGLSQPHLKYALEGGEDWALLFTSPLEKKASLEALFREMRRPLFEIGRCLSEKGLYLCRGGSRVRVAPKGFDHFA